MPIFILSGWIAVVSSITLIDIDFMDPIIFYIMCFLDSYFGDGNFLIRLLMNTMKRVSDRILPRCTPCLRSILLLFVLSTIVWMI